MYRIAIIDRPLSNNNATWSYHQNPIGVIYEEEDMDKALLEMASVVDTMGKKQIELILIVKTVATISALPIVP